MCTHHVTISMELFPAVKTPPGRGVEAPTKMKRRCGVCMLIYVCMCVRVRTRVCTCVCVCVRVCVGHTDSTRMDVLMMEITGNIRIAHRAVCACICVCMCVCVFVRHRSSA